MALAGSAAIPIFFSYKNYFGFFNKEYLEEEFLKKYVGNREMKKSEEKVEYQITGNGSENSEDYETAVYVLAKKFSYFLKTN